MLGKRESSSSERAGVKELYYYLDSTPTHSYMKMLYKYPQADGCGFGCPYKGGNPASPLSKWWP